MPSQGARAVAVAGRTIYWIDDAGGIGRAQLDGSAVEEGWLPFAHAVALTADAAHLYWVRDGDAIARADLDGGGFEPDLVLGAEAVDVAVDAGHVYWADAAHGAIGRAQLDGAGAEPAWAVVGGAPRSLVAADGALFWADPAADEIFRMPLAAPVPTASWVSGDGADHLAAAGGRLLWTTADGFVGRARTTDPVSDPASFATGYATITGLAADERPGRPTVHGSASPSTVTAGTAITPAITIGGGVDPTGSATIALYGDSACAGTPVYSDTVTVNGAGRYPTASFTPSPGSWYWRTTYGGDAGNLAGEWFCGLARLEVAKVAAGMVVSVHGDPVVGRPLHATVAWGPWTCVESVGARWASGWGCVGRGSGGGGRVGDGRAGVGGAGGGRAAAAKSGTVSFSLFGPDDPTCRAAPRFTSVVAAGDAGAQSASFTPDAVGSWRWAASYSGDDLNLAFATNCAEQTGSRAMTIAAASPSLTVATTGGGGVVGEPLSATATLADAYEPSGELTFALHGPGDEQCTGQPVSPPSSGSPTAPPSRRRSPAATAGRSPIAATGATRRRRAAAARRSSCGRRRSTRRRPRRPAGAAGRPVAAGSGAPAGPPPARPAPALARFTLASRCVRPAASGGTVNVGLRLWTGRSGAPRVRVERALGTGGRDRCPPPGSPGRFDGRFRTVAIVRPVTAAAERAAAAQPPPLHHAAEADAGALPRHRHRRRRLEAALPARARLALRSAGVMVLNGGRDRGRRPRSAPCAPPRRSRARR